MAETQSGELIFPEVVCRLPAVGIESYFCDLAGGEELFTCRMARHSEKMTLPPEPIAEEFSPSEGRSDSWSASGHDRYPEFVKRSTAAGVIACWAFLTGKKVIYFGRKGEFPIEEFPPPKS